MKPIDMTMRYSRNPHARNASLPTPFRRDVAAISDARSLFTEMANTYGR